MDGINQVAFNATKEIMLSVLGARTTSLGKQDGEKIAEMFETIYGHLLKIAKDAEVK